MTEEKFACAACGIEFDRETAVKVIANRFSRLFGLQLSSIVSRTFLCRFHEARRQEPPRCCTVGVATMGSSLQIGLRARFLVCGGLERGCLPPYKGKLLLWWALGDLSSG